MLWWDFEFEEQSARACENWMVPSRSASDLWPPLLPASARPFSTTSSGVTPFLSLGLFAASEFFLLDSSLSGSSSLPHCLSDHTCPLSEIFVLSFHKARVALLAV